MLGRVDSQFGDGRKMPENEDVRRWKPRISSDSFREGENSTHHTSPMKHENPIGLRLEMACTHSICPPLGRVAKGDVNCGKRRESRVPRDVTYCAAIPGES
jgi:hypothetical protein